MADNKEYITGVSTDGNVYISEEVIGIIALEAMGEVDGFGGPFNSFSKDIADFIGNKGASKGVRLINNENSITLDVSVLIKYGHSIADVARDIQNTVFKAVTDMTGATIAAVNVNVNGVVFAK